MSLLFPLTASLLYVTAILFLKRASELGAGVWRTTFVANLATAFLFAFLWGFGGTFPGWGALYQPALVAALFLAGQALMFIAIERGDVSIATPVLGTKILVVAGLQVLLTSEPVTATLWLAAGMAFGAVILLQGTGGGAQHRAGFTILTAFLSGICFALFDVLVQRWSPAWGAGRFLPILFGFVALYSFALIPLFKQGLRTIPASGWRWLAPGSLFMGAQAIAMVCGIALYGQATAMNVVYSARGLWSVIAVWLIGHWFHNREQHLGGKVLRRRLAGAVLLSAAIVLVLR